MTDRFGAQSISSVSAAAASVSERDAIERRVDSAIRSLTVAAPSGVEVRSLTVAARHLVSWLYHPFNRFRHFFSCAETARGRPGT